MARKKTNNLVIGARWLLGLTLLVFGLNKFLDFMPTPQFSAAATAFYGALMATGYMVYLIGALEVVTGLMLLAKKYVHLSLLLLAPFVVNILLFHLFLDVANGVPAYAVTVLWLYLVHQHWDAYKDLLKA